MRRPALTTLIALACSGSTAVLAAEQFDFFINFDSCTAAFAPLQLIEDPVKVAEGDNVIYGCTRVSGQMECLVAVAGGDPTRQKYPIRIDAPPNLAFAAENGSDFISINTVSHAAVLSTRIATTDMLGAKICHGVYATTSEMEAMSSAE